MREGTPATSRRTALAGGLGTLGLLSTGCDLQELDPRDPAPASTGLTGPGTPAIPAPGSDAALVAEMTGLILGRQARVEAARSRHRELRGPLRPLAQMHRAHLDVLAVDRPVKGSPAPPTGRAAKDRQRVVRAERTLQQRLARAAERAESGQLAKLLASMSASVAQHLAAS